MHLHPDITPANGIGNKIRKLPAIDINEVRTYTLRNFDSAAVSKTKSAGLANQYYLSSCEMTNALRQFESLYNHFDFDDSSEFRELVVIFDILNSIVLICLILVLMGLVWKYLKVSSRRSRNKEIVQIDDLEKALEPV